jgi:alpha-glucuronidase
MNLKSLFTSLFAFVLIGVFYPMPARAEDGYRLWLRYEKVSDEALRKAYQERLSRIVLSVPGGVSSAKVDAAREELTLGLQGLLGVTPTIVVKDGSANPALGEEGYSLGFDSAAKTTLTVSANRDVGLLYGAFALLREVQTLRPVANLAHTSVPKIQRRILNHWDNLNRFVERGYAGQSLWNWFILPDYIDPRYKDYARANASIGINGAVLTNVNADAQVLTEPYLQKVAAIAGVLRPYGIRVYLTARFSAPHEIGGLPTSDPLDPAVAAWWKSKVDEIYKIIPDFGGFLVKANSEGQPGPQAYGRNHADGANVLADALAPHGGIVMWRAFVYDQNVPEDRVKQAYNEFQPLDGKFHSNVSVQVKNGPLDFQPREPFSPLFGAMPRTPLTMELQITQEYLGGSVHLVFLAPMWKECLDTDTLVKGAGSSVARVIDGSLDNHSLSAIAGVANIGSDRNWCGNPMAASNWYAFGRLAWDHDLSSEAIADEWTRQTFSNESQTVGTITKLLLGSRETYVDYTMPLGLHHIMASGHHYGPGPWVNDLGRADWNPVYYHRADDKGVGFERGPAGSNAVAQYSPELVKLYGNLDTCPEKFLLWFHHVPWNHPMKSGRTLWNELAYRYQYGVEQVREMQKSWDMLARSIDAERFSFVKSYLARQEKDARIWRDACLQYFQQFSKQPLPEGVEKPEHPLPYYEAYKTKIVPGNP